MMDVWQSLYISLCVYTLSCNGWCVMAALAGLRKKMPARLGGGLFTTWVVEKKKTIPDASNPSGEC